MALQYTFYWFHDGSLKDKFSIVDQIILKTLMWKFRNTIKVHYTETFL